MSSSPSTQTAANKTTIESAAAAPCLIRGKILKRSKWLGRFVPRNATLKNGSLLTIHSDRKNGSSVTLDLLSSTQITFCYDQQRKAVLMAVNPTGNDRVREFLLDGAGTDWSLAFSWCPVLSAAPQATMRVSRVRIVPVKRELACVRRARIAAAAKDSECVTTAKSQTSVAHSVSRPSLPAAMSDSRATAVEPSTKSEDKDKSETIWQVPQSSSSSSSTVYENLASLPPFHKQSSRSPTRETVLSKMESDVWDATQWTQSPTPTTDPGSRLRALADDTSAPDDYEEKLDELCGWLMLGAVACTSAFAIYELYSLNFEMDKA